MKLRRVSLSRGMECLAAAMVCAIAALPAFAQQPPSSSAEDRELAESVRELRGEIEQLRVAVSQLQSETDQYRAENQELRREMDNLRAASPPAPAKPPAEASGAGQPASAPPPGSEERISSIEDASQAQESTLRTLYQTKVESASKYRVRLSGLALLNLFRNTGGTDNLDVPSYAIVTSPNAPPASLGATLRQSEIGLEVFGPSLLGARVSGQVHFDFGGGFPVGVPDGANTGVVRLRTGVMRLDWENTSIIAGQDGLFISPNSPTSFASLLVPSLAYSGNLWAWTPQLRVEHRFWLGQSQDISVQAGLLDNLTGDTIFNTTDRVSAAGENAGQPAYAVRTAYQHGDQRRFVLGASGYYSRENWGNGHFVTGWAGSTDWRIPLALKFELSGEFYRGRAAGGLGGAVGQSVLFAANSPQGAFRPLNSAGGWSQLKFSATSRLEFNAAYGTDNPFAADVHALAAPVGIYPIVIAANRSQMANFIYRPRSDLLFSGEFRRLHTTKIGGFFNANQVNLMMGVFF